VRDFKPIPFAKLVAAYPAAAMIIATDAATLHTAHKVFWKAGSNQFKLIQKKTNRKQPLCKFWQPPTAINKPQTGHPQPWIDKQC
jgi:hypothetical protein